MAFLWNVMDRRTRFLLASKLSEDRDSIGAIAAFKEALANAQGQAPENIFTDAHKSYRQGMEAFELVGKPNHIANSGIRKLMLPTITQSDSTVLYVRGSKYRGWKSMDTSLAEGQRLQYNFVKPHMTLNNLTPSQSAGLNVR